MFRKTIAALAAAATLSICFTDSLADTPAPVPTPTSTLPQVNPVDVRIKVYWHVIQSGSAVSQGNITDAQIASQMEVLNTAFTSPSFYFDLVATDHTTNAAWFEAASGSPEEQALKSALRQGTARDLNIYSLKPSGSADTLLGWSTLPADYTWQPLKDGIVALHASLPGGTASPYNFGVTLVMHAGRWLGLYNTFAGGCSSAGDGVSDTPAEKSAAYGCPVGRDSCGNKPGIDPIRNYMDLTDDSCKDSFSAGQYVRMKSQYATYRKGQ
jgi:hypothetical protein